MATDLKYDELLKNTRVFNEKEFIDLDEKEVEEYLCYLGFPKLPSEVFENTVQGKNVLFLLLCKLFQDYNNFENKKKGAKKELKCHHVKLFVYLMMNMEDRGRFSVYNPLVLKMMNIEIPKSEVDVDSYKANLESRLNLTLSLYFNFNGSELVTGGNQLVFSENELNELVSVLNNYMYTFQYFYKMVDESYKFRTNKKEQNDECELVKSMLMMILKQILLLLRIMRFYNKQFNKRSLDKLLVFAYYFYKYKQYFKSVKSMLNDNNNVEEDLLLLNRLNDEVMNAAKNPVKDNLFELLDLNEGDSDVRDSKRPRKPSDKNKDTNEKVRDTNEEESSLERKFGLLIVLPKAVELVNNDVGVVEKVLNKLMLFIRTHDNNEGKIIYVKCYFKVLSVVNDGNLLLSYNSNKSVLDVIHRVMGFVFEEMLKNYNKSSSTVDSKDDGNGNYEGCEGNSFEVGTKNKDDNNKEKKSDKNKKMMRYWWNVLEIISNINLEFIDENADKIFQLLSLDFQEFSDKKLKNKSLEIMYGVCDCSNEVLCMNKLEGCDILPSCNFINNLVIQYNNTNQLNRFFEYVQKYYDKYNEDSNEFKKRNRDKNIKEDKNTKKVRFLLDGELENNMNKETKDSKEDRNNNYDEEDYENDKFEMNYLNNYCMMRSIGGLDVSENEVVKVLKTFEKYDSRLYNLIVVYLNRLNFSVKNLNNVTEGFLRFNSTIRYNNEPLELKNNLFLRLQILVTVRKLLSFYNPFCISNDYEDFTTYNEDDENYTVNRNKNKDTTNSKNEDKDDRDRELFNKLLEIVYDNYLYVNKNVDKILENSKNRIVVLNMVYHFKMINNEVFEVFRLDNKDKDTNKKDNINTKLDVNKMMIKLMNKKHVHKVNDKENKNEANDRRESKNNKEKENCVYKFLLRNNTLFLNNEKANVNSNVDVNINGYLLKNLDVKYGREYLYENLDRKLSLEYFRKIVLFSVKMVSSRNRNDEKDYRFLFDKDSSILVKKLYMLLENVIEMDNSEVISCLLESINLVSRQIVGRKVKVEENRLRIKMKMVVLVLVMLLELLLYVLEYEMRIDVSNCYFMIVRYGEIVNKEENRNNKTDKNNKDNKNEMNLFDVLINIKNMLIDVDNNNRKEENVKKRIFKMVVKYYYLFSVYIYKKYNKIMVKREEVFNEYNNNSRNNRDGDDKSNGKEKEDQKEKGDEQLELINSLLLNYLYSNEFKKRNRDKEFMMKKWDVYFVGKFIRMLKLNGYEELCEMIFKSNGILKNMVEWYLYFVNNNYSDLRDSKRPRKLGDNKDNEDNDKNDNKDSKQNGDRRNVIEMVYYNLDGFVDNKYMLNLIMFYVNMVYFNNNDEEKNNRNSKNINKNKKDGFNVLYSLMLRMIEVFNNNDNKYLLNLYKNYKKDELNGFFKKLFYQNYELYKYFVLTSIEDVEKMEKEENDLSSFKCLLLLVLLINNFNKDKNKKDNLDNDYEEDDNKFEMNVDLNSKNKRNKINVKDRNKEEYEEMYNKLLRFVENRQKYMNKLLIGLSRCENDYEFGSEEIVVKVDERKEKELDRVEDELVLNYLMVNGLYNVDGSLEKNKNIVIGLIQNILSYLNRNNETDDNKEDDESRNKNKDNDKDNRLLQILLRLINMLVSNISQNITVVMYFYIQFNQYILRKRRYCSFKELMRFTSLVINSNNYKYVKGYVAYVINVLIKTYYYLVYPSDNDLDEVDKILMEELGDNFKSSSTVDSKDGKKEENKYEKDKDKRDKEDDKNLEWLKKNIIRYIMMCDNKVKSEIYKMMPDDKIKMFYKNELRPQK